MFCDLVTRSSSDEHMLVVYLGMWNMEPTLLVPAGSRHSQAHLEAHA